MNIAVLGAALYVYQVRRHFPIPLHPTCGEERYRNFPHNAILQCSGITRSDSNRVSYTDSVVAHQARQACVAGTAAPAEDNTSILYEHGERNGQRALP